MVDKIDGVINGEYTGTHTLCQAPNVAGEGAYPGGYVRAGGEEVVRMCFAREGVNNDVSTEMELKFG